MAVGIDMFGTGGEGLGGLFVGNQLAQQRDAAELERQKAMQDMANSQSMIRSRDVETSFNEQTLGDRVGAEREKAAGIKAENDAKKLARTGEQFGQFGAMLEGVPALARPAVLKSMANQAGIGEDNPLYQALTQVDPAQLPATLNQMSQGFYEQSTAGRAEKLKAAERRETEREKAAARTQDLQDRLEMQRQIAQMNADARRDVAGIAANASRANAQTRAGSRSGPGGAALTTDKAIAGLIMNDPDMSPQEKLEALQRYNLNKAVVGKEETTADIMGARKPLERAEAAVTGKSPTKKGTPQITSAADYAKLPSGTKYMDPQGNIRTKK